MRLVIRTRNISTISEINRRNIVTVENYSSAFFLLSIQHSHSSLCCRRLLDNGEKTAIVYPRWFSPVFPALLILVTLFYLVIIASVRLLSRDIVFKELLRAHSEQIKARLQRTQVTLNILNRCA